MSCVIVLLGLNRGESYIDSPEWLKNKGATINPKSKDNECFQYPLTVALNHKKIKKDPQRISKIKSFIDQYKWKGIEFPSHSKDWKKFEKNSKTIALKILFISYNTKQIRLAYKSKYNHKRNNEIILLMITDGEKWHYLTVKSLPTLLRGIASNNHGDFYCLNGLHSYRTKKNFKNMKKVCNDHDYCYVKMPNEYERILKYNHGEKSLKCLVCDLC